MVKRYSWEFVSNFITNNTAKIQLKILGHVGLWTHGLSHSLTGEKGMLEKMFCVLRRLFI